ncbi:mediator of RNA polymerase II transcription subunit 15 [Corythoichthys intestinalis]|uniref:mediator of RNA polymerase II transcription subunit 15 n=1 Tax=Corythoichthys intestinalis TaxID=161448 RepID=UPI0025A68851|nr:mediator of RNA polymerase II transcription subunit 15 [Corythoichthys intestinalis]
MFTLLSGRRRSSAQHKEKKKNRRRVQLRAQTVRRTEFVSILGFKTSFVNLFWPTVAMEVPGPDSDWRSPQFRQKVVAQIDEAMRKAGTVQNKTSTEMENQVYVKAKTRDEYLSLVARLIIHYRDIHKKNMGGPDPINALTNLTGVGGGPGAIGMGPRPAGAPLGGMGAMPQMQIGQHAMPGVSGNPQPLGGPAQLSMQQQQQQNLQFQQFQAQQQQFQVQQQLRVQQQQMHQQQQNQQQQNQMHQSRMQQQQQMVQLQLQQQQQHVQAQSIQHMVQQQQAQPGPMQPLLQQQQATMVPQSLAGQMAPAQHVPINSLNQQQQQQLKMQQALQARVALQQQQQQQAAAVQAQMVAPSGQLVRPNMQLSTRLPRPPLAPSIPPPNVAAAVTQQVQTPQSMPPPPQPSPQPPSSQPNSVSSGPTPSPGGFQPSPSPQPSQSPSTARTPQNYGVPSPGALSTPGNPNSVMSPAGAASQEDQQYMEKLKQLSKYIEPLRRMINKIDKNEERKKDLSKMKSLLNILTDPNTRCPLKTLQKCEIALEKLKNDMAVPTPPPPPLATKQHLCQPLLDTVMANLRSPVFNHSLHRTFAPAMAAIHGPPITGPSVSSRKRKQDEDERQTVPNILQGEVARLDVKFLVQLDPAHCSNNGAVHLVCKLEDKNLPSVPPLQLSVPADYPEQSPYWAEHADHYGANHFLQAVHRTLASKLLQLPDKHSLTEVLHTWAQSVHQARLSAA